MGSDVRHPLRVLDVVEMPAAVTSESAVGDPKVTLTGRLHRCRGRRADRVFPCGHRAPEVLIGNSVMRRAECDARLRWMSTTLTARFCATSLSRGPGHIADNG